MTVNTCAEMNPVVMMHCELYAYPAVLFQSQSMRKTVDKLLITEAIVKYIKNFNNEESDNVDIRKGTFWLKDLEFRIATMTNTKTLRCRK